MDVKNGLRIENILKSNQSWGNGIGLVWDNMSFKIFFVNDFILFSILKILKIIFLKYISAI